MRRSLRFKLLSTFGLVFAAMTAAAVLTVAVGGIARTDVATMDGKYVPAARLVGELHLAAAEVNADQSAYLLAENPSALAAASASLDPKRAVIAERGQDRLGGVPGRDE